MLTLPRVGFGLVSLQSMKFLILGAPCSGKTTLVNLIRESQQFAVPVLEMDEEIRKLNDGEWPEDNGHQSSSKIYDTVAGMEKVIFFTSYLPDERLHSMTKDDFKIIQLQCPLDILLKRNAERMKNDPTLDNESLGIMDNVTWQRKVLDQGIVSIMVDANVSLKNTEKEIVTILKRESES